MKDGMHALVTGGAGFIGSHLCERLIADGHRVTVLDSFDDFYAPSVKRRNIAALVESPAFTLVEGDIRSVNGIAQLAAMDAPDVIVHLAARAGVRPSLEQPELYTDVNVSGTVAMLEFARRRDVRRFVFGSSSSVYGDDAEAPFSEGERADRPISPYAATKRAGELLVHTYHHLYGMSVACLRFFTVYGPRQRPDLAIHKFARRIMDGEQIDVYGDGSARRDFTFVADIIAGVVAAIEWTAADRVYEVFNLGESETTTVSELIALLERAIGTRANVRHLPMQPGDVVQTFADVSKARELLGYRPTTPVRVGIVEFVRWLVAVRAEQSMPAERAARGVPA